jgi:hypothetical protein
MLKDNLEKMLEKVVDEERKVISVSIKKSDMEMLELIAKNFSKVSDKNFTRQMLIEEAIQSLIEESKKLLTAKYNISDLHAVEDDNIDDCDYDTVVVPAKQDGFIETFLGEECWYYIRINEKHIPKLKYISIYVGKPVSAISHYAEIDRFEFDEVEGKYIVYFKGKPQKLDNEVPLGNAKPSSVRSPKYTTLSKIKTAFDYTDL